MPEISSACISRGTLTALMRCLTSEKLPAGGGEEDGCFQYFGPAGGSAGGSYLEGWIHFLPLSAFSCCSLRSVNAETLALRDKRLKLCVQLRLADSGSCVCVGVCGGAGVHESFPARPLRAESRPAAVPAVGPSWGLAPTLGYLRQRQTSFMSV